MPAAGYAYRLIAEFSCLVTAVLMPKLHRVIHTNGRKTVEFSPQGVISTRHHPPHLGDLNVSFFLGT